MALAAFVLLSGAGWAQDALSVDKDGTCPSFESGDEKKMLRMAAWSFVPSRSIDVFRTTDSRSRKVDREISRAFEGIRVLTFHRRSDNTVVLFTQFPESGFCGWVPAEQIFQSECLFTDSGRFDPLSMKFGPRALRAAEVDKRLPATCETPLEMRGLTAKVVLHNINKKEDEAEQDGIRLYYTPGVPMEQSQGKRFLKVADAFHVFDIAHREEYNESTHQNDREMYYLIGRSDSAGGIDQSDRFLVQGWVRERDVFVWSTRYAAFWSGSGQALGYKEPTIALSHPEYWVAPSPEGYTPPADKVPAALPLLEETGEGEELSKRLLRLVVRGGDCRGGAASCAAAFDLTEERRKLADRLDALARVDVLFLLDNSRSMDSYFELISELIPEVSAQLAQETSAAGRITPSIRVAIATYGDYLNDTSSSESLDYRTIFRFADISDPQAVRRLRDALDSEIKRVPVDEQKDLREGSFAATIKAAQTEGWREEAGFRVVVHLGDHGNRDFGKTSEEFINGQPKSVLIERVSQQMAVDALCRAGVYYAPIAVQGSSYDEVANGAFVDQARGFSGAADSSCGHYFLPPKVTYGNAKAEEIDTRRSKIRNGIEGTFATTTDLAQEMQQAISCIEGGRGSECLPEAPQQVEDSEDWGVPIRNGITQAFGFDEVQLRNLYGQAQPSLALYYHIQNDRGSELFDYYIAASMRDVSILKDTYQELCDIAKHTSISVIDMQNALVNTIELASGDTLENSEDAITEFLKRINNFPAKHLHADNNFLAQEWPEVHTLLEIGTIEERRAYSKAVCRAAYLLRHVSSGKRVDLDRLEFIEGDDENFGIWQAPDDARVDYTWDVPSINGMKLFFIPLEYFMYSE